MTRDLKFAPYVYGLGAGLFFIGYLLLELPVTRLVAQGSPRFWLVLMLVSWRAAATAMGFINSVGTFYVCRILLGIAEAGFFPGIIVYLSRWFPRSDRARAIAAHGGQAFKNEEPTPASDTEPMLGKQQAG